MARRPVVNREELFSVANDLAARGKQVTALAILAALGGGSLTTIYKYLEEWESLHQTSTTSAPASSNEIPDVVHKSFLNVWNLATAEASRNTAGMKLEIENLTQQLEETQNQVSRLNEQLEKERSLNHIELAKLEAQIKELTKKADKSTTRTKQRDDAIKEAAELRGQLKALSDQNSELLAALAYRKKR
ncbi:MAG: DNA-binding protein [Cyanobacteria bacterium]|nr:DNA-binding protein [Cyanobacteriota bacterium]